MSAVGDERGAERLGVVGAGLMGSGIAEVAACSGVAVVMCDSDPDALERSRAGVQAALARATRRGTLAEEDAADALARLSWHGELDALADSDVVVEAVVEDRAVKAAVLERVGALVAPEAILASNTSSIPIAELAAGTPGPERVLGLHFFSPVRAMALVEVVPALGSAAGAVERAERFVRRIGKTPIRGRDRAGFIVNRLLVPYLMSAVRLYDEGLASCEEIDAGMRLGCGHPVGPLKLCDLIGLDVLEAVCESLYAEFRREQYAPPPLLRRMVAAGRLGRKSGHGFYPYASEAPVAA
jgi:3-hydroxybutyryl-CoA dehydrogenase